MNTMVLLLAVTSKGHYIIPLLLSVASESTPQLPIPAAVRGRGPLFSCSTLSVYKVAGPGALLRLGLHFLSPLSPKLYPSHAGLPPTSSWCQAIITTGPLHLLLLLLSLEDTAS